MEVLTALMDSGRSDASVVDFLKMRLESGPKAVRRVVLSALTHRETLGSTAEGPLVDAVLAALEDQDPQIAAIASRVCATQGSVFGRALARKLDTAEGRVAQEIDRLLRQITGLHTRPDQGWNAWFDSAVGSLHSLVRGPYGAFQAQGTRVVQGTQSSDPAARRQSARVLLAHRSAFQLNQALQDGSAPPELRALFPVARDLSWVQPDQIRFLELAQSLNPAPANAQSFSGMLTRHATTHSTPNLDLYTHTHT